MHAITRERTVLTLPQVEDRLDDDDDEQNDCKSQVGQRRVGFPKRLPGEKGKKIIIKNKDT